MKIENRKVKIIIAVIVIALCAICFYAYYYNKTPNNMKSLEEVASQEVDLEKEIQSVEWEHAEYDYPAMIMVQDVLYYDSGEISTEARCGMMDGEITTMAEPVPSENDQSNFGIGYGYQYGTENTIDVCMDDGWHTFVLYEKEKFDEVDKLIEQKTEEEFSFAEFRTWKFEFLSGAGGWATYLTIEEDGSFFGEFFDGELGITGEDYPNGTMYQCHFQGRFTQPIKVNEFTYSMKIAEISYENEPGTEEIINGMRYCYATPYGLEGAEDILIYTPKAPLSELSEEYRSWVRYLDHSETGATELSFWGLYNVKEECGFGSYDMIGWAKERVAYAEENAADLEKSLENDPLTQAEYNEKSQILYANWDYALNCIWDTLQKTLDEDEMNALIIEEREWIAMKELAVKEAGAEVEGGSMQPMVMNLKAAELTKEKVYELIELLE